MQPLNKKARLSTNVNGQMSNPMLMGGMMGQGMLPAMMTMNPMASMLGANPMLASMIQASMNHQHPGPGHFHSGVLEEVHEDNDDGAAEDAVVANEEDESGPGPADPAMGPMGSVGTKAPPTSKPVCPSLQPQQNQPSKPNVSQGFALSIVGDTIEEAVAGVMQARRTLFQAQKDSMPIPRCVKFLGGLPKARPSIHQPHTVMVMWRVRGYSD